MAYHVIPTLEALWLPICQLGFTRRARCLGHDILALLRHALLKFVLLPLESHELTQKLSIS